MPSVREVMTTDPIKLGAEATIISAARVMRDNDIGDVLVTDDGQNLVGIVTDRDIVVRAVADGSVAELTLGALCSDALSVSPEDEVGDVIEMMRDQAVRRIPVVDGEVVVGLVALGDLAVEFDPDSVLGDISEAPENN
jgi:CBS domain-containing protein